VTLITNAELVLRVLPRRTTHLFSTLNQKTTKE
jgi:hypothetical protein